MSVRPFYALELKNIESKTSVLRQISGDVDWRTDDVESIVQDLTDTFRASKISVGLAAVQIGVLKRVFIVNTNKVSNEDELIVINPTVVSCTGGNESSYESCMSMPNLKGRVKRKKKISIDYFDAGAVRHFTSFSGFTARVVQHEMDHLNGVLCLDHIEGENGVEVASYLVAENYPVDPIYER